MEKKITGPSTPRLYKRKEKVHHRTVYIYKPIGEKEKSMTGNKKIIFLFVKKHKFSDALGVNKT